MLVVLAVLGLFLDSSTLAAAPDGALSGIRHRVLVSTDVGGTDPDDIQSLVHLLLYADVIDLEGLISSPYGPGTKKDILDAIDAYEEDYPALRTHSSSYPAPDQLRQISKQGAKESPGIDGLVPATEGSRWIIERARNNDPRPLHILVWGGIEDLARALHDAPEITPSLRVYFIGGPNKKWSANAYNYIEQNHPKLWIIEANASYRGWFVGGIQEEPWDNHSFVATHIDGHGALGAHFVRAKATLKMGDTPSIARLLKGFSEHPELPGWGGSFVPIWDHRKTVFTEHPNQQDLVEVFGITEFLLSKPNSYDATHNAKMIFNQSNPPSIGHLEGDKIRFRFSPRDAKVWKYDISSNHPELNGQSGAFTAVPPATDRTQNRSQTHPHWWIDDPSPSAAEGIHPGAKTVNRWRREFLSDFQKRIDRCFPTKDTNSQ